MMKKISFSCLKYVFVLFIIIVYTSCSSARFYKDYSYVPREQAPDISAENQPSTQEPDVKKSSPTLVNSPRPETSLMVPANQESQELVNDEKMEQVILSFKEEMAVQQELHEKVSNRQLIKKVSQRLTQEGKISPLSKNQENKLDRMATKMDKKLKKADKGIDFAHNTPLELFFMIMGIVGLVVGIIGQPIGWFVFIVFAGLWLYFKLVEDKK
jgi:hypothetical protein